MTRYYCPKCRRWIPPSAVYRNWLGAVHDCVGQVEGPNGEDRELEETHKVKEVTT